MITSRLELTQLINRLKKERTTTSTPHRPRKTYRHALSPQAASSGCLVTAFMRDLAVSDQKTIPVV